MHGVPRRLLASALALVFALTLIDRSVPVSAASRPPKFDYQLHTLDNGLSVILNEDHSTPIVHVSLWYYVG